MPAKTSAPLAIYQLKITLLHSRPPIWRRVLVPGHFTLHKLHLVIQLAMGWEGGHLHHFLVDGQYYSCPYQGSDEEDTGDADSRRVTLAQIAPREKRKFVYEYDFGDSWEHEILVEKILPPEPGAKYPQCVKGKGACPPEDVGGVWGYANFLEAIHNPEHEEHEMYLEWIGGEFDPEAFDLERANLALKRVK
jgi:hypothetical protein